MNVSNMYDCQHPITQCLKPGDELSLTSLIFRFSTPVQRQVWICLKKLQQSATYKFLIMYHKESLYTYLPETRSPFRSTALSGQKSNSSSGRDQISSGYI